jgi:hypothetical protein
MSSQAARVTIDLTATGDPIAGQLTAEGRAPRPFTGWLQLISGLQEAVETLRDQAGDKAEAGAG